MDRVQRSEGKIEGSLAQAFGSQISAFFIPNFLKGRILRMRLALRMQSVELPKSG